MKNIIVNSKTPIRLDRYLRRLYPNITQGIIEKAIRKGDVKLNEVKATSSTRTISDDVIKLSTKIFTTTSTKQITEKNFSPNVIALAKKLLSTYLIFTSDQLIAINKPAGIAVQGGSKISLSIDDALYYINQTENQNLKLVHRLDKETSGILLIAKNHDSAAAIGNAFRNNVIKKTYYAILSGHPKEKEGVLINKIGKDRSGIFEIVKELKEGGKIAETNYKVISTKSHSTLVKFHPKTGRTHQLRFHSKYLNCPIVGDIKYGGPKYKRMMLHAKNIVIPAEVFGELITIKTNLPIEFDSK